MHLNQFSSLRSILLPSLPQSAEFTYNHFTMRGCPFQAPDEAYRPPIRTPVYDHDAVENSEKKKKFVVTTDLLIPGKGDAIRNAFMVVEGSKVRASTVTGTQSIKIMHPKHPL
jgi:hypothetical protein